MFFQTARGIRFIDRGDVAAWDWTKDTLIKDDNWHDLDLSSIIPVGTKFVLLRVEIVGNAIVRYIQFRKKGNTNTYNMVRVRSGYSTEFRDETAIVVPNASCIIEYLIANGSIISCNILVKGWFV